MYRTHCNLAGQQYSELSARGVWKVRITDDAQSPKFSGDRDEETDLQKCREKMQRWLNLSRVVLPIGDETGKVPAHTLTAKVSAGIAAEASSQRFLDISRPGPFCRVRSWAEWGSNCPSHQQPEKLKSHAREADSVNRCVFSRNAHCSSRYTSEWLD